MTAARPSSSTFAERRNSQVRSATFREARNIPVDALPSRFDDLRGLKDKSVILVCHTDKRSARAAALLSEAGFRNVRVLHGGMVRWHEAGLPVADRQ